MSYLVLARKWRPKRFAELVGQEHVVRALTNALHSGRVHHAFLFTGTRGVGKTTIARIFSKSLNCERGTSADPCGECSACRDIDAGRFVDLLEIDAASNTGVDDVRELIENAQYLPSRGRAKVYLIDEVHMLSKSAFNALLKTLEEPPEHVKFLLATTDPQKLPVTVLSRCLQFNLRRLEQTQILGQMEKILAAEAIEFEPAALRLLARGADGSLRDGLSLLDQAIAYSGGRLSEAAVTAMLGTVDRAFVGALLQALSEGDGVALMQAIEQLAAFSPDFGGVLDDVAAALHAVQVKQLVPGVDAEVERVDIAGLASALAPEVVQLWYQMAVSGRRDLPYAPSPRAGFEMVLLRMLAFRPMPADAGGNIVTRGAASNAGATASAPRASSAAAVVQASTISAPPRREAMPYPAPDASVVEPSASSDRPHRVAESVRDMSSAPESASTSVNAFSDADAWLDWVGASGLKGPALALASHASFISHRSGVLRLGLAADDAHLNNAGTLRGLTQALSTTLGAEPRIVFDAELGGDTHHARQLRQRAEQQSGAHEAFLAHPAVGRLLADGGVVNPDSIRPFAG